MYETNLSPLQFGQKLKEAIMCKENPVVIGRWASDNFFANIGTENDKNIEFREILLKLSDMILEEKAISYEELDKIADDIIEDCTYKDYSTRKEFGKELKKKLLDGESPYDIGTWASSVQIKNNRSDDYDDADFDALLTDLALMQEGEGFELSYEELDKIADGLISRKVIKY